MERKWLQIRVLPIGEDTTPWLQDERWIRSLRLILDRLDENQRRWVLALLSLQVGRGGISRLSEISHVDNDTFTKARKELAEELKSCPRQRIRRAGGLPYPRALPRTRSRHRVALSRIKRGQEICE